MWWGAFLGAKRAYTNKIINKKIDRLSWKHDFIILNLVFPGFKSLWAILFRCK